ncbi:MAG: hypothetical protein RL172_1772 [Bacteroidota bacterium]
MEYSSAEQIKQLVQQCLAGDAQGYKQLYQCYAKAMYNTCLRILNNVQEAEDVLQESFAEAFKNLSAFEHRSSFGGWLKQICINRSINQLKKRRLVWIDADTVPLQQIPDTAAFDEQDILLKVNAVKKSIMQLPDGYRTVLTLHLLEGYDYEEIAQVLQVANATVRSQYLRAKQKLIQFLNSEYEQAGKIY